MPNYVIVLQTVDSYRHYHTVCADTILYLEKNKIDHYRYGFPHEHAMQAGQVKIYFVNKQDMYLFLLEHGEMWRQVNVD